MLNKGHQKEQQHQPRGSKMNSNVNQGARRGITTLIKKQQKE
jgi:hypothetical protein